MSESSARPNAILSMIADLQDIQTYQELTWEGSFAD